MAGFQKEDAYFVPRALIVLPYQIMYYVNLLLPQYGRWVQETNSTHGDKSDAAKNFLELTLPYYVEVLVQDGIYLVRDFPNHPISLFLKVK